MTDSEKDRRLLENIDRLLAGKENEITGTDEDSRTVLNTAKKLASVRKKPSKEFSANLKAELIHRLAEQERKERSDKQPFLFWELSRRTMWQGTVSALIVVAIAIIIFLISVFLNRTG